MSFYGHDFLIAGKEVTLKTDGNGLHPLGLCNLLPDISL